MLYEFFARDEDIELQVSIELQSHEVWVRWLPVSLGGPYPGGTAYVEPFSLFLRHIETGQVREVSLGERRVIGLAGSHLLPGQPMHRVPVSVHIGLARGSYQASLRLIAGDAVTRTSRERTITLGTIELPSDLGAPRHAPFNELAVRWVDRTILPPVQMPAPVEKPLSDFSPERFFAGELRAGARTMLEYGYCPWQTIHLPPQEHPAPPGARSIGDYFHERGLGMYLESLSRAACLTGDSLHVQAARYAAEMLITNVNDAPWGGKWWACNAFGENDNCLHIGMCCHGLIDAYEAFRDERCLQAAADVLATWPYDAADHAPHEIIDRDGQSVRPTFVYNQRFHLVLAMLQVGRRLGRVDLVKRGSESLRLGILPGMRADGYWPYLRSDMPAPAPHYQLLLLKLLSRLAWEPGWSKDGQLREVIRRSMEYALNHWVWKQEDLDGETYLWSDVYAQERRPQLALAKAGCATAVLGWLAAHVDSAYLGPLIATVRGIYAARPSQVLEAMGLSSWLHSAIVAPVLDLRLHGYRFWGDGITPASLQLTLSQQPDS